MFSFRSTLFGLASCAVLLAASAVSATAYEPLPAHRLVAYVSSQATAGADQQWVDLGDLQATRYMIVTATQMTNPTTMTFLGPGPNGESRSVVLANGVPTHIDFGTAQNADGTGELIAFWSPTIAQTSFRLDISVSNLP